jgi:hypothetical protein
MKRLETNYELPEEVMILVFQLKKQSKTGNVNSFGTSLHAE